MADFKMKLPGITDKDLENSLDRLIAKATEAKKETEQLVDSGGKAIKSLESTATAVSSNVDKVVEKTTKTIAKSANIAYKELKRLEKLRSGQKVKQGKESFVVPYSDFFTLKDDKANKAFKMQEKEYNGRIDSMKKQITDFIQFVSDTQNDFEKYDGSAYTESLAKGLYDTDALEKAANKYIEKAKVTDTNIKRFITDREKAYLAYKTLAKDNVKSNLPQNEEEAKNLIDNVSKSIKLAKKMQELTSKIGSSDKRFDNIDLPNIEENAEQLFKKMSSKESISKFFGEMISTFETETVSFRDNVQRLVDSNGVDFSGFVKVPVKETKKEFDESLKLAELYVKKLNKFKDSEAFSGKAYNVYQNIGQGRSTKTNNKETQYQFVGQAANYLAQGGDLLPNSKEYYEKLLKENAELKALSDEITRQVQERIENNWELKKAIVVTNGVKNPVVVEKEEADAVKKTTDALEKKAEAQKELNKVESIYSRAQQIRNEGNVTDYDGNDWNYSKTMLYKYYDGIVELQSKISRTTDTHMLDDLNKDLDNAKIDFVALYDTIDAFFEGKLNSRAIKADVRNLFNQLAPQEDINAYKDMIFGRGQIAYTSLPLFNEESTGQLAMQIEGVTEASWDLGKAEKSTTEDIKFMNTALEGQIELMDYLAEKETEIKNNQEIKHKIKSFKDLKNILEEMEGIYKRLEFNKYNSRSYGDYIGEYDNSIVDLSEMNDVSPTSKNLNYIKGKILEIYKTYKTLQSAINNNAGYHKGIQYTTYDLEKLEETFHSVAQAYYELLEDHEKTRVSLLADGIEIDKAESLESITSKMTKQFKNYTKEVIDNSNAIREQNRLYNEEKQRLEVVNRPLAERYELLRDILIESTTKGSKARRLIQDLTPMIYSSWDIQGDKWGEPDGIDNPYTGEEVNVLKEAAKIFGFIPNYKVAKRDSVPRLKTTSNTTAPLIEQEQKASEEAQKFAKIIADSFGVKSKTTIERLGLEIDDILGKLREVNSVDISDDEFSIFANTSPDYRNILKILAEDESVVKATIGNTFNDYDELREYVSKSIIKNDSIFKSEFGDDWLNVRNTIGSKVIKNNQGTDIMVFLQELNDALGRTFDVSGNAADGIRQLYEALSNGKEEKVSVTYDTLVHDGSLEYVQSVIESNNQEIASNEEVIASEEKKRKYRVVAHEDIPKVSSIVKINQQETQSSNETATAVVENEEKKQEAYEKTAKTKENANKKNKEYDSILSGSYTIADSNIEELLRRKVEEINSDTGKENAKYRILTDAQNEILSAEISYVNKNLGQTVTEIYALHKANEEIEGDEDALILKGKKLSQDTIAAEEKKQKAIESNNEALRQQLERIKNIDSKINDPKNNINNISDIETLAYAKNDALNKIYSLKGSSNATKTDIGEVKNIVNEYERVANEIIKATQLSSKQISSDDNVVRIESLITNITKLIEKTKEYAGTSEEIDKMISSLKEEQKVLRETSDILQGKTKDNNGNVLSISSQKASDVYYSTLSDYKKNSAVFEQIKIEQDNKARQKAEDYQFLIDKINELAEARKKLQSLESNARKNPTIDYSEEINQQKSLIQTLEQVVELNKVDFNTMSSDGNFWNVDRVKEYTDALNKAENAEKNLDNQRQLFDEKDQQSAIDEYKKALSDLEKAYKSFASNANGKGNLSIQIDYQKVADAQQRVRELGDAAQNVGVSVTDLQTLFANSFREISSSVATEGVKTLDDYRNKINALSEKMEENGTATDKTRNRLNELKEAISSIIQNADFSNNDGLGKFLSQVDQFGSKLKPALSGIELLGKFDSKMLNIEGSIKDFDNFNLQTTKATSLLKTLKQEYQSLQESLANNKGQFGQEQIEQLKRIEALVSKVNKEAYGKGTLVPESQGNVKNIDQLATAMQNYATANGYTATVGKVLQANTNELTGSFKAENGEVLKLTVSMNSLHKGMNIIKEETKQTTGFLGEMGNTFKSMAKRFSYIFSGYVLVHKLMSAFREGLNVLKDYDNALTTISYTMDLTKRQLNEIGESAVQMAKDLSMSLDNAMSIYQIYANMNTTAQEIAETAKPTAILSNLSGVDTSTAADQVQGILQQFDMLKDGMNDTAEVSMHVVDVLDKISASVAIDYAKGIGVITEAVTATGQVAYDAGKMIA